MVSGPLFFIPGIGESTSDRQFLDYPEVSVYLLQFLDYPEVSERVPLTVPGLS